MRRPGLVSALLVLVAINIMNFYDRNVSGALAEPMRKEFHLSDGQIGLIGSVFIWLYALVGVPFGRIADRWNRKYLLALGMIIWSALTAYAAIATSIGGIVISRLGVGIGEAVAAPTATSWIGDLFPATQRSRALAVFMLGVPIGGALSYFFSGPAAQVYGWRVAMALAAAPAMLLLPALLMLREPERGATERHRTTDGKSVWTILRIPTLWWIIASGALVNFIMYAVGQFLPAFLSRVHGISLARSGVYTGAVYIVGGVAGGVLAGWWGDRIIRVRQNGRLVAAACIALLAAPFSYIGIAVPATLTLVAVASLTLAYGALNSYYGLVYSSIHDIVPPQQRGTAMAIYFMLMYLLGASFGPYLTGHLSDVMARRAANLAGSATITEAFKAIGLQQAMLVIPVLAVALAVVLWAASRTIAADANRQSQAARA